MTPLDYAVLGFWLGVVAVVGGQWAYGKFLACVDAYPAPRRGDYAPRPPMRADRSRPNMELVARARQLGPVYHEEPSGMMVRLLGREDMRGLWPEEL